MYKVIKILLAGFMGLFMTVSEDPEGAGPVTTALTITWDKSSEKRISSGGYPRAHRLNDGRLMMTMEQGGNSCYCLSSDNALSWGELVTPWKAFTASRHGISTQVNISNPEFAQLSHTHPRHPDRIIFATNLRPKDAKSTVYPYSIAISVSDDRGGTWTGITPVYQSEHWDTDHGMGCWEPFVLELPDGTVQIYFSDQTPYFRNGKSYQNISVIESGDGGDTWGPVRICAYTEGYSDGMPVVLLEGTRLYLAIEHNERGKKLHPQIILCPVRDNWFSVRYGSSHDRFDPMKTPINAAVYAGAPYLIATDHYFVLSYQSSAGASVADHTHAAMEVVACPKSEMNRNGKFYTLRGASRPFTIDQTTGYALWNSLCDLGDDAVLALSATSSGIRICRGRISAVHFESNYME